MNMNEWNLTDRRRLRVAVFGEWGETNLGDWAIYQGVQDFFARQGVVVDAYRCGALQPFEASTAEVPQAAAGRAPERKRSSMLNGTAPALQLLKRSVRGLRQEWLVRRLMPRLAQADLVCVGGGALLCDRNLHFPQSLVAIARAAQSLRKPLWCLGCSVDGDWTPRGEQMILEFLDSCEAIAVRDVTTAERLGRATGRSVPVFGDFALPSRPAVTHPPGTERRFVLGINVSQIPTPWDSSQERYEDALVAIARSFLIGSEEQRQIALFTTGTPQDEGPLERVHQRLAAAGVVPVRPRTVNELEDVLDQSEIVIATRLHAAIVGLGRGRPVIGLSPTPKVRSFFASIGLERFFLPLSETSVDDVIRMMGNLETLARQWEHMDQSQCLNTREELSARLQGLATPRMAS